MKTLTLFLALLAVVGSQVHGATPLYVTADVPTTETLNGTTLLPWQIFRYDAAGSTYTLMHTVPGTPHLDAIHKLDGPGAWLFSTREPSNLAGALSVDAEPRDVVRFKSGSYSIFFCPAALGVPASANLDSLYLEGGDSGNLVASFDIPVELPAASGIWYDPGDLIRFRPTGTACGSWILGAPNPAFDASASGAGMPTSYNVIGGDRVGGRVLLSIDVPADLAPSAGPLATYLPGQIALWDGVSYDDFEILGGWPISSRVDGLARVANPGLVGASLRVNKAVAPAGDLVISWQASCTDGAQNYGIYQGAIGSWYSHRALDCDDAGGNLSEQVTPGSGNLYFLVVPLNYTGEGGYGTSSSGAQRPIGTSVCASPQLVTNCP